MCTPCNPDETHTETPSGLRDREGAASLAGAAGLQGRTAPNVTETNSSGRVVVLHDVLVEILAERADREPRRVTRRHPHLAAERLHRRALDHRLHHLVF